MKTTLSTELGPLLRPIKN